MPKGSSSRVRGANSWNTPESSPRPSAPVFRISRISAPNYELDADYATPDIGGSCRDWKGRIRLHRTREWFFENGNLPELVSVYQEWVNQNEYLHLALFEGDKKIKEIAVLASKRGNSYYRERLRMRLSPLLNLDCPAGNRSLSKSKMLFVTLTYDTKLKSPFEAWQSIPSEFNRWITNLRNKLGRVSYLRAVECTKKGYPHLHLVLFFKETEFSYFSLNGKFRIPNPQRKKIRAGWHSFVDVEAVVSPKQAIAYTIKYILKAHGDQVAGKTPWEIQQDGVEKTLALLWVYKKRGWTVSQDIEEAIADLIAKPCVTQILQTDLWGKSIERWVFLGVKPAWEFGIYEDPPPKVVVLWQKEGIEGFSLKVNP